MVSFADVDPVRIVLARLQTNTELLAAMGGVDPARVSGLNEPPYPHLRVAPSAGGDDGVLDTRLIGEVNIEMWGDLDGSPGSEQLRRLLYQAVEHVLRMAREIEEPGQPVVIHAHTVGTARWQPDQATKQPCWAHTVTLHLRPA
jgi:hypothetical protein